MESIKELSGRFYEPGLEKVHIKFPLPFHRLEFSYLIIPNCKGGWDEEEYIDLGEELSVLATDEHLDNTIGTDILTRKEYVELQYL